MVPHRKAIESCQKCEPMWVYILESDVTSCKLRSHHLQRCTSCLSESGIVSFSKPAEPMKWEDARAGGDPISTPCWRQTNTSRAILGLFTYVNPDMNKDTLLFRYLESLLHRKYNDLSYRRSEEPMKMISFRKKKPLNQYSIIVKQDGCRRITDI